MIVVGRKIILIRQSDVFEITQAMGVAGGSTGAFVPMNANFGIIEPLGYRVKGGKTAKNQALADRALEQIEIIKEGI